jgi:hypothetical protein
MDETVAFSTDGLDTHNAFHTQGNRTKLFTLLKKLGMCKQLNVMLATYTVPVSGVYMVQQHVGYHMQASLQHMNAGDIIPVDINTAITIHRIGS